MPTRTLLRQDQYLTDFSLAKRNEGGYIYDMVFPPVDVQFETGKYAKYGDTAFLKFAEASANFGHIRGVGSEYGRYEFDLTTAGSYSCVEYGHEFAIDDRLLEDTPDPINLEEDGSIVCQEWCAIEKEKRAAAIAFDASTTFSGRTAAVATGWDISTSDVHGDANTAHQAIQVACGRRANMAVMGQQVFDALMIHPQATDQIKYVAQILGGLPQDALAKFLRVNSVAVGGAITNANQEGEALSGGYIWGKYVLFCYNESSPSRHGMSCLKSFRTKPFEIFKYREEKINSMIIRGREIMDEVCVAATAGYLFSSVVS